MEGFEAVVKSAPSGSSAAIITVDDLSDLQIALIQNFILVYYPAPLTEGAVVDARTTDSLSKDLDRWLPALRDATSTHNLHDDTKEQVLDVKLNCMFSLAVIFVIFANLLGLSKSIRGNV